MVSDILKWMLMMTVVLTALFMIGCNTSSAPETLPELKYIDIEVLSWNEVHLHSDKQPNG